MCCGVAGAGGRGRKGSEMNKPTECPACGETAIRDSTELWFEFACGQFYLFLDGHWQEAVRDDCTRAFASAVALRAELAQMKMELAMCQDELSTAEASELEAHAREHALIEQLDGMEEGHRAAREWLEETGKTGVQ